MRARLNGRVATVSHVMDATDARGHPDRDGVTLCRPELYHGAAMWRLARDSQVLDLNSGYAYLLFTHDFAATSTVALHGDTAVGFVVAYLRPESPDTVVVWQIAVDTGQRGARLGARMLHELLDRLAPRGVRYLATTITPSNEASQRLFAGLARDRGAPIRRSELFATEHFPQQHEPEQSYLIGPLPDPDLQGRTP